MHLVRHLDGSVSGTPELAARAKRVPWGNLQGASIN